MSAALTTRPPAAFEMRGDTLVEWRGPGVYERRYLGFGVLWALTTLPEGSYNTVWCALPCDAFDYDPGADDPAPLLVGGFTYG